MRSPLCILTTFLFLSFHFWSLAQSSQVENGKLFYDSITAMVENGKEHRALALLENRMRSLHLKTVESGRMYELFGEIYEIDGFNERALEYFRKAYVLATEQEVKARAATGIANALITAGSFDSVTYYIDASLRLDKNLRNETLNKLALGRIWQSKNIIEKSLHEWQSARELAKQLGDSRLQAMALAGMSSALFSYDPGMKRVMQFLTESNSLCDSVKHANILARNFVRLANAFMVLGDTKQAERFLNRAKPIMELTDNPSLKSYVLSSFAILKSEQGDIESALAYSREPLRIKRQLGQLKQVQNDLLNISEWQTELKQYQQAKMTMEDGIETSKSLGDFVYLGYFYSRISTLDSITGNYPSAYSNLRRSIFYKDSAESLKRFRAVEEVREKYESEQKEKLLAEQEVEIERQKLLQVSFIAAAFIVILLLVVLIIVLKSRHRKKLQEEKEEQYRLQLEAIIQTQEDVQQSIARDLHDGLVQIIGAAKMSLESVGSDTDKSITLTRISNASRIMDDAVLEARNISHQILPYSLLKGGLEAALEELLSRSFQQFTFKRLNTELSLHEDVTINVYRITQELVNNVIKHSEASHVELSLSVNPTSLTLLFQDDGKGFDWAKNKNGVGLTNIKTRTEFIRGHVEIDSHPGTGTRVKLTVPI